MFSQIRWPEAESVVMLGCNDDPFHSGITGNLCPLVAIKPGGIEDGLFFITITPFLVCESINSKMDKHVVFHFMPGKLLFCRHWSIWFRRFNSGTRYHND